MKATSPAKRIRLPIPSPLVEGCPVEFIGTCEVTPPGGRNQSARDPADSASSMHPTHTPSMLPGETSPRGTPRPCALVDCQRSDLPYSCQPTARRKPSPRPRNEPSQMRRRHHLFSTELLLAVALGRNEALHEPPLTGKSYEARLICMNGGLRSPRPCSPRGSSWASLELG